MPARGPEQRAQMHPLLRLNVKRRPALVLLKQGANQQVAGKNLQTKELPRDSRTSSQRC